MWTGNSVTSVHNSITSSRSRKCRYFTVTSKECYAPRLRMMITYVDHQANIYRLIRMDFWEYSVHIPIFENNPYMYWFLRIIHTCHWEKFIYIHRRVWIFVWVRKTEKWWHFHGMVRSYRLTLHIRSNFLYLITLPWTARVTEWCYIMVLHFLKITKKE